VAVEAFPPPTAWIIREIMSKEQNVIISIPTTNDDKLRSLGSQVDPLTPLSRQTAVMVANSVNNHPQDYKIGCHKRCGCDYCAGNSENIGSMSARIEMPAGPLTGS